MKLFVVVAQRETGGIGRWSRGRVYHVEERQLTRQSVTVAAMHLEDTLKAPIFFLDQVIYPYSNAEIFSNRIFFA